MSDGILRQELRNLDPQELSKAEELTKMSSQAISEAQTSNKLTIPHPTEGEVKTRTGRVSKPVERLSFISIETGLLVSSDELPFESKNYQEAISCDDSQEWIESMQLERDQLL